MAYRNVQHACGHWERINVDDRYVVVESRVKRIEATSCDACAANKARRDNRLDGFRPLWGPKRLCDLAEPIRRRALAECDLRAAHAAPGEHDAFGVLRRQILGLDDAAWWVEHKRDAIITLAQRIEM